MANSIINATINGLSSTGGNTAVLELQAGGVTALSVNASGFVLSSPIGVTSGGTGLNATGTSGNVLTSNGSVWVSQAAAAFDSGTVMLFGQTSAPTGWTKDTTNYNNSGLRVVTGSASTGGSVDFTTAFASQTPTGSVSITSVTGTAGSTTLTTPQIPSHTHSYTYYGGEGSSGVFSRSENPAAPFSGTTGSTGGGGSHDHPFSFSSGSGTFSGNAINLAVKYVDVIRATKD